MLLQNIKAMAIQNVNQPGFVKKATALLVKS